MGRRRRLLWALWSTIVAVTGIGATAVVVASAPGQLAAVRVWALLATMAVVEALAVRAARGRGYTTFTSSTIFGSAALLTDGLAAGMPVFAVGGALTSALHRRPVSRLVFNAGQLPLAALLAAAAVGPLAGRGLLLDGGVDLAAAAPTAIALVVAWFLANLVFLLPAVVLTSEAAAGTVLRSVVRRHVPTALGALSLAPLVAVVVVTAPALSPLLAVPMASLLRLLGRFLEHEREAQRDALTGLANRRAFGEAVEAAVDEASRTGRAAGVLAVDLDGFKELNDAYGHPAGDEVLRVVAHRLEEVVRGGDTVARLGGDEFGVVLGGLASPADAWGVLHAVEHVLLAPMRVGEELRTVRASVGAATSPCGSIAADALVAAADASMYDAKQVGREPGSARVETLPPPHRRDRR